MKKRFSFWFVTAALVALVGIALAREWRQTQDLQATVVAARISAADADKVKAENHRLRENAIPAEALARLRADHAALPRLRAELEALSSGLKTAEPTPR